MVEPGCCYSYVLRLLLQRREVLRRRDVCATQPFENLLYFPVNGLFKKALAMESVETKSAKSGDAVLKALQEVQKLSVSQQNEKRANLFYRFVTGLRGLHSSALDNLVPKMVDISRYFVGRN